MAANLRPFATVTGPLVHLSDLFSGLEPGQDCALGPGPGPGAQIVIGEPQLQAIADEFGVSWSPGPGWQASTLSRPGELLNADVIVTALRPPLTAAGVPSGSTIVLSGWQAQSVDPGSHLSVESPTFDPQSRQFTATIVVSLGGHVASRLEIDGTATTLASLVVPSHPIMSGEILREDDLTTIEKADGPAIADDVRDGHDAVGLMAVRPLVAAQPIALSSLKAPPLVTRGDVVMLQLSSGGLTLSAEGSALDTGALGERIRVLNPISKAVLVGTVSDRGTVTIDPDSTPMILSGNASLPPGFPHAGSTFYAGSMP